MNMKKLLSLVMAMMLAVCGAAFAETEADLQAQLDAANARIAELEALINDVYLPVYESQIVVEFGDGGVVWADEAKEQYEYLASMYSSYGISMAGFEDQVKMSVLSQLTEQAVLKAKVAELGMDQFTEEELASFKEEAATSFQYYVDSYKGNFMAEGTTDEEAAQATIEYLAANGLTEAVLLEDLKANYASEKLYNSVVEGVTVSEEEIKASYDSLVAAQQEDYADDYSYNSDRSAGETIAYNPEGYRAVKHALIMFSDEQAAKYTDLNSALMNLQEQLAALEAPAEETAEEAAEEAAEETAEPRTKEEIQADISAIGVEIEALYSELLPKAQEVIDAFNGGASFEELMAEYNEDPGMDREPNKTLGYAVSANSTYWETAFTEGAMSIAEIGQISAPVYGSNGIHIIYYMGDITPGAVAFEEIAEAVETNALESKITETYNNQVGDWMEEADPIYHADRF